MYITTLGGTIMQEINAWGNKILDFSTLAFATKTGEVRDPEVKCNGVVCSGCTFLLFSWGHFVPIESEYGIQSS